MKYRAIYIRIHLALKHCTFITRVNSKWVPRHYPSVFFSLHILYMPLYFSFINTLNCILNAAYDIRHCYDSQFFKNATRRSSTQLNSTQRRHQEIVGITNANTTIGILPIPVCLTVFNDAIVVCRCMCVEVWFAEAQKTPLCERLIYESHAN